MFIAAGLQLHLVGLLGLRAAADHVEQAAGARLKLSAPFCTWRRLLPCRACDSACSGLSSPFTAGAVLPAVKVGSMLSAMPTSAAMRFSVLASGADSSW